MNLNKRPDYDITKLKVHCACSCAIFNKLQTNIECVFFGITSPKTTSSEKLEKKKEKYEPNEFPHLNITEAGLRNLGGVSHKKNLESRTNGVHIFKNGSYIYSNDTAGCYLGYRNLVSSSADSTNYRILDSVLLRDIISKEHIMEYDSYVDTTEYVILVYWASYTNALVYYVNLDLKEGWSINKIKTRGIELKR